MLFVAGLTFAALVAGCCGSPTLEQASTVRIEDLDLTKVVQDWGIPRAGRSVDGNPLRIGERTFERGLGTHAKSEFEIRLDRQARRFRALVGVDAEVGSRGSVTFEARVDGRTRFVSGVLKGGEAPVPVDVDLTGGRTLVLLVGDAGDGIDYDHANWADAVIELAGSGSAIRAMGPTPAPPPAIARFNPDEVGLHGPRIVGATPMKPFLFRIPATGKAPLQFDVSGLPAGIACDPKTGIISGRAAEEGTFPAKVTLRAANGVAERTLTIVIGYDRLALTPPMGWNSWNVWGTAVDADKVRAAADRFVATGLANVGYQYVNIDDAWEGVRDGQGVLQTNDKFGDMKALADAVHAHGLKLGIYSSPGPKTCAGFEGSYGYERIDAETWAAWGIDYLKHDWCSYGQIAKDSSLPELQKPYKVMRDELRRVDRDIVYSLCQYGMGDVAEWGGRVGGNLWRTTGDIVDTWSSMSGIGFSQDRWSPFAGPGRWNDPDMLVVGKVGWGPNLRDTRLNKHEQVTHITLWTLLAAPMLIGCDLTQLDEWTRDLLCNTEVIDVNQDPLGRAARRRLVKGDVEVWSRPLFDGTVAVGLFNRGRDVANVTAPFESVGTFGAQPVRDLWKRQDLGVFRNAFSASVPPHGAVFVKIGRPRG